MSDAPEGPVVLPDDASLGPEVQVDYPGYRSTRWRAPKRPLLTLPEEFHTLEGPVFGDESVSPLDSDLTRQHDGEPLGERLAVHGRVLDEDGRPLRGALVEVWQANAAGRYRHQVDQHPAPLDPNFSGAGRCLTDAEGRYRFVTVKPGAYPWGNHENAWRPAHIHFSLFGRLFTQRLVTQMYFPGDPLFPYDPIFNSVRDPRSRELLVSRFDLSATQPEWALAYEWDIVLGRGARDVTPVEPPA
ncbi:MAG TPA: protocatechuate 3,4-dioxygenase subunit beta [Gaiellaceae bacterium]